MRTYRCRQCKRILAVNFYRELLSISWNKFWGLFCCCLTLSLLTVKCRERNLLNHTFWQIKVWLSTNCSWAKPSWNAQRTQPSFTETGVGISHPSFQIHRQCLCYSQNQSVINQKQHSLNTRSYREKLHTGFSISEDGLLTANIMERSPKELPKLRQLKSWWKTNDSCCRTISFNMERIVRQDPFKLHWPMNYLPVNQPFPAQHW